MEAQLSGTFLDGIVRLANGSLLVSSWIPPAIHWVDPTGGNVAVIKTFAIVDPGNPLVNEVPADQDVVVICRSGNRSQTGRAILLDAGFENVTSTDGGMNAWSAAGYPTE